MDIRDTRGTRSRGDGDKGGKHHLSRDQRREGMKKEGCVHI